MVIWKQLIWKQLKQKISLIYWYCIESALNLKLDPSCFLNLICH